MDPRNELLLGIFLLTCGIYPLVVGLGLIIRKKESLPLQFRIELWLIRLFQGEKIADQVYKIKGDPIFIRSYRKRGLFYGVIISFLGIVKIISALRSLGI